ncbi:MAG TPA: hypothetical protein VFQ25_16845 [Ktedonobacterales bacterium]|nr:hypothetical protein [Ktedonobacterales bacterium]
MDTSDRWIAIVFCLIFAAIGGFIAFVGWRQRAYPESNKRDSASNYVMLMNWGLVARQTSDEQRAMLATLLDRASSYMFQGMGIGGLCGALLGLGVSFAAPVILNPYFSQNTVPNVFLSLVVSGWCIGAVVGHLASLRSLAPASTPPTGALQRPHRRVTDYLSLVVIAWPLAAFAIVAEVYLAIAAQWSSSHVVSWLYETPRWPGAQLGVIWLGATLLLPVVLLLSLIWATHIPDPALAGQPAFVTRVGDMLRARTMTFVIMPIIPMLWMAPIFAAQGIPRGIQTGTLNALMNNPLVVGVFCFLPVAPYALLVVFMLSGRLGGRIAGWWRQLPLVDATTENATS